MATEFRHNCLQDPSPGSMGWPQPLDTLSEDCLYLNVYAPTTQVEPAPVLFWIHGGGYIGGGGNETRLNGTWDVALLQGQLLAVTINYRLGAFGFLAADELRARDSSGGTGNYGILDQRLAMHWVQDNIQRFGGDPGRVFIVGQSAGANSVSQHLTRPKSWGLFSSAGLESGAFYEGPDAPTVASQQSAYEQFLQQTGCETGRVACLVSAPASALLKASMGVDDWTPVVDDVDLTEPGVALAMAGKLAPVPVLVGSVSEDGMPTGVAGPSCQGDLCTRNDFVQWVHAAGWNFSASDVNDLALLYADDKPAKAGNFTNWYWGMQHAGADQWSGCYARRTAHWVTRAGQQAYFYRWTYAPLGSNGAFPKLAHHAVEQPFVFHVLSETPAELRDDGGAYYIQPSEVSLSSAVVRFWSSMAKLGQPTSKSRQSEWPGYDEKSRAGLVIGRHFNVTNELRGPQCDFWDKHFNDLLAAQKASEIVV